jgi:tetratricopeptide (TPR) repeat protein
LEAIELHQDYADLHKILGDLYVREGDLNRAKEAYRASLAINPHFEDALLGLVIALRRSNNVDEANRLLGAFIEAHPSNLNARTLNTADMMNLSDQ